MWWFVGIFACVALFGAWVTNRATDPPTAVYGMISFGAGVLGVVILLILLLMGRL